jgi:hypothetical protein
MIHKAAAHLTTWKTKSREAIERRARGADDDGLEAIEVVVLSAVGLAAAIALGVVIKAVIERYSAQLV